MTEDIINAEITRYGALDTQVCVPAEWDDSQVKDFANRTNPSGTGGWHIRKEEDPALNGDPERVPCTRKNGFVHIMLDA